MAFIKDTSTPQGNSPINSPIVPARVLAIDQSNTPNNGVITVEVLSPQGSLPNQTQVEAFPLFPNIKNYPLINEMVLLVAAPTSAYSNNSLLSNYYYLPPVNIWNDPQVNPTPNPYQNINTTSQNKSVAEVEAGSPNQSNPQDVPTFKPGTYFEEKDNIYPLYPFEGDVIIEGRFGNSIRFGSTDVVYAESYTTSPVSKTFAAQTTYSSGETGINNNLDSQLNSIDAQVAQFKQQYPDAQVAVVVEGGESRVTNPNNLPQGALAEQRANNVSTAIGNYSNISTTSITKSTTLGDTPYTRGQDSANDPRYTAEQYSKVTVQVKGTQVTPTPSMPSSLNVWSESPKNGDPITIIRNGQPKDLTSPVSSSIVENPNTDLSSIWLTSTQKIPIEASSINDYYSYEENKPTAPNQYVGNQIILNSERLFFNSKTDHILFSSAKSINLNAQESINFDTIGPVVMQAKEVYLGGKEESQPLILGQDMIDLLSDILGDLGSLANALQNQIGVPAGSVLAPTNLVAQSVNAKISGYKQRLQDTLSKTIKTV